MTQATTGTGPARQVLDGTRIRTLRLAAGLSEREPCAAVGLGPPALVHIEDGRGTRRDAADISLHQLRVLADALGVAPAALFLSDPHDLPDPPDDARALVIGTFTAKSLKDHPGRIAYATLLKHGIVTVGAGTRAASASDALLYALDF